MQDGSDYKRRQTVVTTLLITDLMPALPKLRNHRALAAPAESKELNEGRFHNFSRLNVAEAATAPWPLPLKAKSYETDDGTGQGLKTLQHYRSRAA
jgi:hypothetical protein